MSLPDLKGKGLFVFSDPGGAKPVLAVVESLKNHLDAYQVVTNREYSFFNDFSIAISQSNGSPEEVISSFQPDFILTGTSYTSSIELDYIAEANQQKIPTLSFVDHWTKIRERFLKGEQEVFPEGILLIDEKAKKIAVENGIPESKIQIIGNPYHEFLKNWKPIITKKELYEQFGLKDLDRKLVVYGPDPLSNVEGKKNFGFDELEATEKLVGCIEGIEDLYFVFNPHPNQRMEVIGKIIDGKMKTVSPEVNLNTLLYFSSAVIGFFSSILIEALLFEKKVFRFLITREFDDPFSGMNIGEVVTPENIAARLKSLL
ncbi:MAG: hypothetical protein JSS80_00270 [Bacteroidetes bacterium]|nr:hypothetical protein [Bacteroidota bacterium]